MDMSIVDWLLKNKEWVFSGVGVTAIVGVLAILRTFNKRSPAHAGALVVRIEQASGPAEVSSSLALPVKVEKIYRLVPEEIREAIDAAPPVQRDAVAERYKGLRVEWGTSLESAGSERDGTVKLYLRTRPMKGEALPFTVICTVRLSDYHELSILPRGTNIRVDGVIDAATSNWVELTDARLAFISPADA